jgi:hypothetical protein
MMCLESLTRFDKAKNTHGNKDTCYGIQKAGRYKKPDEKNRANIIKRTNTRQNKKSTTITVSS